MGIHIYKYRLTKTKIDFVAFRQRAKRFITYLYNNSDEESLEFLGFKNKSLEEVLDIELSLTDTELFDAISFKWKCYEGLTFIDGKLYKEISCPWVRLPADFEDMYLRSFEEVKTFYDNLLNRNFHHTVSCPITCCSRTWNYFYSEDQLNWLLKFNEKKEVLICG